MPKHKVQRPSQDETIRDCAKEVCDCLAGIFGPSSISPEVMYGVHGFLHVAVRMLVEQPHTTYETEEKFAESNE